MFCYVGYHTRYLNAQERRTKPECMPHVYPWICGRTTRIQHGYWPYKAVYNTAPGVGAGLTV